MRHIHCMIAIMAFALVACGGDDDDGQQIDAPEIDAPLIDAPAVTNALGQVCVLAAPNCPEGNTCTGVTGVGSTTNGYCSPTCDNNNALCTAGYTGPAGGTPVCALTTMQGQPPSLCAIICTMPAHCPQGLTCQAVPNTTTMICAPPA